jgi:magnesium transporter
MDKLRYPPPGSAPATLRVPPEYQNVKPQISLIQYDAHTFEERSIETINQLLPCLESEKIGWINIDGLGDVELFEQLAAHFRIHQLALEDMLNLGQRPKVDEYDRQLFIVLDMAYGTIENEVTFDEVTFEQVSIVLTERVVITVQERPGDVFASVRQRLREGAGNARYLRADYLAYVLIDAVIDQYFPVIESLGASMDDFQQTLLDQPTRERVNELHDFRRLISRIRRAVWPHRDVVNRLMRDESGLISGRTRPYLRDCYDNTVVMLDMLESFRDSTANFMDLYLSTIGIRTNEIMRVLTLISSIFIPLTFIAGIYGMNFDPKQSPLNMPELEWPFGYPFALCLMLAVAIGMVLFFKRKKWL